MKTLLKRLMILFSVILLTACSPAQPKPSPSASPAPNKIATPTPFRPAALPVITPTVAATPTQPAPPETISGSPYSISVLRARSYGGGMIEAIEQIGTEGNFTRYLIRYPSDGLSIYGHLNIPNGEGPHPTLIVIHGYAEPDTYATLDYPTDIIDALSRAGYLVFHPNMRGYHPSDDGDNQFRVGMSIDILNLIALIKMQGLQPGLLEKADPNRIGIWGHSMGGEIALRVIIVSSDVKATILYAPMSGDTSKNAQFLYDLSGDPGFQAELNTPDHLLVTISPSHYYSNITSAISLYHGTADTTIPIEWSVLTCEQLKAVGKNINCTFYEGAQHTFSSKYSQDFSNSFFSFFQMYLHDQ